jgi:hypothetical protein
MISNIAMMHVTLNLRNGVFARPLGHQYHHLHLLEDFAFLEVCRLTSTSSAVIIKHYLLYI